MGSDTGNKNIDESCETIGGDFRVLLRTISRLKGAMRELGPEAYRGIDKCCTAPKKGTDG